jgi:hypothetical protein
MAAIYVYEGVSSLLGLSTGSARVTPAQPDRQQSIG